MALIASTCVQANEPRPIYARPAATAEGFRLDSYFEYYDGLLMQEAEDLKGWTAGFDLTLPLTSTMALRLLLPVRTEADATIIGTGQDIEIEGWMGVFDFASLYFEHQLSGTQGQPSRFAYYLGFGSRTSTLKTGTHDEYQHQGRNFQVGGRYDYKADSGSLFVDTGVRWYEPSDDLNPGDPGNDSFWLLTIRTAWLWNGTGTFTPGVELVVDAGESYLSASVVPEIIWQPSDFFHARLGVPLGVSSDAPDYGGQVEISLNF
ncbi:MAG: hypothetical protein O3A63_06965 [Proteobacteria bacterium]|nr:hypothetical protein [Pseudomonadota bacterium]